VDRVPDPGAPPAARLGQLQIEALVVAGLLRDAGESSLAPHARNLSGLGGRVLTRSISHYTLIVRMFASKSFGVMTLFSGKNPFRPGVGLRPVHLAGRDAPLRRFAAMLRAAPEQHANMRVTGLRGVGKTVLLEVFAEQAEGADWEPAFLEFQPGHNTDAAMGEALGGLLERARARLSRMERLRSAAGRALRGGKLAVSWDDISVSISPGSDREADLARDLFQTVELAVQKGRTGLVLLLDEAQLIRDERDRHGEHPLSLLIAPVVALQRQELPLALVVCGLPTLAANLQRARSYSERLFRGEEVDSLPDKEALEAFTRPLEGTSRTTTEEVAGAVIDDVEGYPYFIQLWGSELWDGAELSDASKFTLDLLEATRPDIYRRLDRDFYDPRVATLTPAEQDVLLASASCDYPPLRTSDLNKVSDKTPGNINVLLGRLADAGAIYRIRKGEYAYTAPKFRDYLQRRAAGDSS
jgi:AAA ATPase domain